MQIDLFDAEVRLFGVNFSSVFDELLQICRFYCDSKYKLPYIHQKQRLDLRYTDFFTQEIMVIPDIDRECYFDCFQFVWFILKKLCEGGVIYSSVIKQYTPTIQTMKKLDKSLELGFLSRLNDLNQLLNSQCGVIFFGDTLELSKTRGMRHLGFYFVFEDTISMISNRLSQNGVVEDSFSKTEFMHTFATKYTLVTLA